MQNFHIRASIYDVAPEALRDLLQECVGEITFRSRMVGYQFFYNSSYLTLSVETADDVQPTYNLDARFQGTEQDVEAWVKKMCMHLDGADILYLLDYVETDAAGEEIGEEVSFAHPDFDARYAARIGAN